MTKREQLMKAHRELATGSAFDMEVAREILRFLRKKEIRLYLSDVDHRVETILEAMGFHMSYSRNYNSAYTRLR